MGNKQTAMTTRVCAKLACAAAPVASLLAGNLLIGVGQVRGDAYWTDATDNWNTTSAWLATQGNILPPGTGFFASPGSGPAFVNIGNGGTVTFNGPDVGVQRVYVGYGAGVNFRPNAGAGTLNITSGTISTAQDFVWGDGAAGTINVNGGTLVFNADSKHMIVGSTGDVTVNLSSGNIQTARYGFENGGGAFSTFNMSGGNFEFKLQAGGLINNAANTINVDKFNFSGGTLGGPLGTGGGITFVTIHNISGNGSIGYRKNNSSTEVILLDLQNASTWSGVMAGSGNGTATSGDGNLAKQGAALTINSPQQFHRDLRPQGGLLTLDYATNPTGLLDDLSSIALGGGQLVLKGAVGGTTELIGSDTARNGLRAQSGGSILQIDPSGATFTLDTRGASGTGNVGRGVGGVTEIAAIAGGTLGTTVKVVTSTAGTNGVIKGYTTNNGTEFATNDLSGGTFGNIVPFTAYTADTDLGATASSSVSTIKPIGAQSAVTAPATFNGINLTGAVGITMTGAGALELSSGSLIGNTTGTISGGTLTVRAPTTPPTSSTPIDLIIHTPADLTISSNIVNNSDANSPVALTKAGAATLTISGTNNTYSDATYVSGGTLKLGSAGALPSTTSVVLSNTAGAALDLNGNSASIVGLSGGGPNGGEVKLNGGATLTVNPAAANTYSGTLSGNGNLIKTGSDVTLANTGSTYTGATTITGGNLFVTGLGDAGSPSSIGAASASAANLVIDGGTLRSSGRVVTSTNRLFTVGPLGATLSGGGWVTTNIGTFSPLRFTGTGTLGMSGTPSPRNLFLVAGVTAPSNSGGTERAQVFQENLLAAVIPDSGAGNPTSVTKSGAGVWYLSGLNTYTGPTTINGDPLTSQSIGYLKVNTLLNGGVPSSVGASGTAASNLVIGQAGGIQYVGTGGSSNREFTVPFLGTATLDASGTGALTLSSNADITGATNMTSPGTGTTLILTGSNTGANTLRMGIPGAAAVVKNGPGTWVLSGNLGYTGATNVTPSLAGLSGGTLRLETNLTSSSQLGVTGSTVQMAPGLTRVIKTPILSVTGNGKVDIGDNKMIINTTPTGTWNGTAYTDITGLIASGRNGSTVPLWDGSNGIVTTQSQATGGNLTSIGVAQASDVRPATATATALWAGQTITGSDTLVMYTYGGDATLDGKINIDDYVKIDSGIAGGYTGWVNGDFNYDGKVSIDDYITVIDANIGNQGSPIPFVFPTGSGIGGGLSGVSAVPEPAGLSILALCATGLLSRRRRSRKTRSLRHA
jgi:fibronectin-binding autotransporter adhesin